MSDRSINAYAKKGNTLSAWVWYSETATALQEGQGVCYEWDYNAPATANTAVETAATADGRRTNRVKLPTILNAPYFAGVAARSYPICSTGQLIEIYLPGSTCMILCRASLTIGVGRVTCQVGGTYKGYFTNEGFAGQGSARPLQTIDSSTNDNSTVFIKTLARLEEGAQSGLQETLTTTAGGATVMMVGGVTHFATATNASSPTFTIAAGTMHGQKKRFVVDGTQTTSNVVVTFGGTAMKYDNTTTLATITMGTAGSDSTVEWVGYWHLVGNLTSSIG